jgi:hypothetical protein
MDGSTLYRIESVRQFGCTKVAAAVATGLLKGFADVVALALAAENRTLMV